MPFRVFDKLKNEIWNSILRFWFYLNMINEILDFYFEFLMLMSLFVFHFHKKMENKMRQFVLPFSQLWFTRHSRASSCQVAWGFPLCNGHADAKNPLFRKQLMYFNVYITGCYFHKWFILIVYCDIKHISRISHREVSS